MTTLTLPRLQLRSISLSEAKPLAVITGAALALRLLLLDNALLWYDEGGSVWMASLPFWRMVAATAGDTHPPLYLAALWAWVHLVGTSEAMVRLPSVLFSVLCVPLTFVIARRLELSRNAALLAAGLMAVLPPQLYYAQEARMYALLSLTVAVALWAALARRWVVLGIALAAGFYTHNYGLPFAVMVNAAALWKIFEHRSTKNIFTEILWLAGANTGAVALWFPWMFVLINQMRQVSAGYWLQPVTPGSVLYSLHMIVWGFNPDPTLQAHQALLTFGAVTFAAWRARLHRGARLCLLLVLIAFAVPVVISVVWTPILIFRALLPASLLVCILIAHAFDGLTAARRWVVGLGTVPLLALGMVFHFVNVPGLKGDVDIYNQIEFKRGDIIYHANDGSLIVGHAYTPADWPQFELPATWRDIGVMSPATREAMGIQVADLHSLTWRRAWLIHGATPMTALEEDAAVQALLDEYPHQLVFERDDVMTRMVMYLLWNKGVAVQ